MSTTYTAEQIEEAKRQMRVNVHAQAAKNSLTQEQVANAIERGNRIIDKMMSLSVEEVESMTPTEMIEEAVEQLPEVEVEDRERIVAKSKKVLDEIQAPGTETALLIAGFLAVALGVALYAVVICRIVL